MAAGAPLTPFRSAVTARMREMLYPGEVVLWQAGAFDTSRCRGRGRSGDPPVPQ
jgi:hypothetical protein